MTALRAFAIYVCVIVFCQSCGYDCLDCYHCDNIKNISDCLQISRCNAGELCFTETTGIGDQTKYTLGCKSKQMCVSTITTTTSFPSIIGRALAPYIDCSQCCGHDACNKHICTTGSHALGNSQCQDDPSFDCAKTSSIFNICGDVQHARQVCADFCGLCGIPDGAWSLWTQWSTCSRSCGTGSTSRSRQCNNPAPGIGGLPCVGNNIETDICNLGKCPVHGGWSRWSAWGSCSVSCGVGLERRDRSCSSPYPGPNGAPCSGDARDDRACFVQACADGGWTPWSSWGSCSRTCLGGITKRTRSCTSPTPSKFGHDCIGNNEESNLCNTNNCPATNGGWATWTSWSTCTAECDGGTKTRTRTCTRPAPSRTGHTCTGNNEEVTICSTFNCLPPVVRLVNGTSQYNGRLEVFHSGHWGTVCDDLFILNNNAAKVVCRMLHYPTDGATSKGSAYYGPGKLPILLDDIYCTGTELSIFQCAHSAWTSNDCGHGEDVGVSCQQLIVRLVGGTNSHNGRLEIQIGNSGWGTVCDDIFSNSAAQVVCRMLGYPTSHAVMNTTVSPGSGHILLDNVQCTGQETSLSECRHNPVGTNDCTHPEDVGVTCA